MFTYRRKTRPDFHLFFSLFSYDVREFRAFDVLRRFSCSVVPIVYLATNIGCHKVQVKRAERKEGFT